MGQNAFSRRSISSDHQVREDDRRRQFAHEQRSEYLDVNASNVGRRLGIVPAQKNERMVSRGSMIFPFSEIDYYLFGVVAGMRNLLGDGFSIGLRKTIGKISQPINSYTRFPEYYYMDQAISRYVAESRRSKPARILDVGSPKCFGLYLANKLRVEVEMTDVSRLNLDEYQLMSKRLEPKAKGHVHFATQDARSLDYEDAAFDIVY